MRKKFLLSSLLILSVILALGILTKPAAQAQGIGHEDVLIGFKKFPGKSEKAQVEKVGGKIKYIYHLIPVIAASIPATAIKGLKHKPNVTYVEEDGDVFIAGEWTVSELADSWGVDRIDADQVWDNNDPYSKGAGVYVAIIDTGIDKDHPDLIANIADGVNFAPSKGKDKTPDPDAWDDGHGHGTHCAGIVAADDNEFGVVGIAPDLRFNNVGGLYGVKVLDDRGRGKASDFIAGLQWAVDGPDGFHGTADDADIISISLRMYGEGVEEACDAAYAEGVLLVSSAGNNWGGGVTGPAYFHSVVAVSATGFDGVDDFFAEFSSQGPEVELAAPGVDVYSTYRNGGYTFMDGTSMACPHVAGVAALAWATGYYVNGSAVRFQLNRTAEWLDGLNSDQQGNGLVDAEAAVVFPESAVNFELSRDKYDYNIDETAVLTAVVSDEFGNPITDLLPDAFETNLYDELYPTTPIYRDVTFQETLTDGIYTGELSFSDLGTGEYSEIKYRTEVIVIDTQRGLSGIDEEIFWVVERTGSLSVLIEPLNYPPCYTIGDTIYVQVTVMDAGGAEVPGADVHVELNNAAGRYYLRDETTDEYGVAEFRFKTKKPDGIGTYLIRVWASKSGYPSTYDEMEICVQ